MPAERSTQKTRKGAAHAAPFFLRELLTRIGRVFLPIRCPACERWLENDEPWPLCAGCLAKVERLAGPLCERCGAFSPDGRLCPDCLEGRTPAPAFPIRSAARYGGAIRRAILAAKAGGRVELAAPLGGPLVELALAFPWPEGQRPLVVPVPLHKSRLLARGFNLPDRMALRLARRIGGVYAPRILVRTHKTESQVGKTFEQRIVNMEGAFRMRKPQSLEGRRVFLVDDVATSGSTLAAAAEPLIASGADVVGLTLARA